MEIVNKISDNCISVQYRMDPSRLNHYVIYYVLVIVTIYICLCGKVFFVVDCIVFSWEVFVSEEFVFI